MNRRLMAVLAHPDDESYGMGGTLARYAAEGVDVHVVIATDGSAGSTDDRWQGDRARLAEVRTQELRAATEVLGATLHMLDFRDSGYVGDPANEHPEAFVNCDVDEATGRLVELIRRIQPGVVISHDETGGYYHPDHIQACKLTTAAFFAAGRPDEFPDIGPAPYQADRLYYSAFSTNWVKLLALNMRLRGVNPKAAGRNRDVDFTQIGVDPERITTVIRYRKYWDVKVRASAHHVSQGGSTTFSRMMPPWLQKLFFSRETYIRIYPAVQGTLRESDFFTPDK